MWKVFLLALLLFSIVLRIDSQESVELTQPVQGRLVLPNGRAVIGTPVVLDGGDYRTISRIDGSFTFRQVPSGIYALEVYSTMYHFPLMRLKVSGENATVNVVEYKYPGAARQPAPYPIVLTAMAPIQYQVPKPPFSLLGMLMGNPMILLMLFTAGMAFLMPKMMANMTPEELEELKKQSAAGGDPMAKISKLMGMPSAPGDDEEEDN